MPANKWTTGLVTLTQPRRRQVRLQMWRGVGFAGSLLVVLLATSAVLNPHRFAPSAISTTVGMAAPLILAAVAATPVILAGRGGIDLSVGPLMGLVNVLIVHFLIGRWGVTTPFAVILFAIGIGVVAGLINGLLANVVHIQPIVATLGTYLIFTGLALWLMPTPGGTIPGWLASFSNTPLSVASIALIALGWWAMTRTPFYEHLMATGGDDRAAFASGINITGVRLCAYTLTGSIAGVGALSLTALLGSADASAGPNYTMTAIAAAALGGVSLAGGIGGISGAILGAIDIFLLQSILTYFNVSTFVLQIAYGAILVLALVVSSPQTSGFLSHVLGGRKRGQ